MENYSYCSSHPSGDSSPRSREIDFVNPHLWEESHGRQPAGNYRVKFMCSYGGKIHTRPTENRLSYIGGETKILAVYRSIRFGVLLAKLAAMCDSESISFKYQLPGEDLDALISVTNDDDLQNLIHEYERLWRASTKPARLRIFVFQALNQSLSSSTRSFGSDEVKSDNKRFVEALNSPPKTHPLPPPPPSVSNVDFLFGLDNEDAMAAQPPSLKLEEGRVADVEDPVVLTGMDERFSGLDPIQKHIPDPQRLKLEEKQGIHLRKSDDNLGWVPTGGEICKAPVKFSQVAVHGGVPYWTDNQVPGGFYSATTVNHEQPAYHAPLMMKQLAGSQAQGYYTVQRMPPEVHRDQQQQMNNMVPQVVARYSDGLGMVTQVAYDGVLGRQVVYGAAGVVVGGSVPGHGRGMDVDKGQGGPMVPETAGK